MKHSDSLAKIAPALLAVQAAVKAVPKDGFNPHFKNKFATLDAILEAVRPLLVANGLSLVQGGATPHTGEDGKVTALVVETMLVHSSGEWISNGVVMPLAKQDPQGAGGAVTYGRRYSLSLLLALATDDDDDGQQASTPAKPKKDAAPKSTALALSPDVMPFGRSKGTPIAGMETEKLQGALEWAIQSKKYPEFVKAAQVELDKRGELQPA